jgi:hypothetical protein
MFKPWLIQKRSSLFIYLFYFSISRVERSSFSFGFKRVMFFFFFFLHYIWRGVFDNPLQNFKISLESNFIGIGTYSYFLKKCRDVVVKLWDFL